MRNKAVTGVALGVSLLFASPLLYLVSRVRGGDVGALVRDGEVWRWVANSMLLASVSAVGGTLLAAMAGFGLARYRFAGRGMYLGALLSMAALPPQLLLPGGYEVVARLGLFDTRWAVLLPGVVSVLSVLLYRTAMGKVPEELLDAARVDGCGEWRMWWGVAMPVVRPTTAACLLLGFAGSWNAVVWPAVVLQSRELQTMPIALAVMSGTAIGAADQGRLVAATMVGLVPVMGLFVLLQREFLPGLLKGAVKG